MTPYQQRSKAMLLEEQERLTAAYREFQQQDLHLDMSRGKPGAEQLELSMGMLNYPTPEEIHEVLDETGLDVRNYGILDGLPRAKRLFTGLLDMPPENIIVGGNSSLNLMYDTIARACQFGVFGSKETWNDCPNRKFLCPVPGYDRHFAITEAFGFEMINIPMSETGPDMDMVEEYVNNDPTVKGIWCVPMYSNPEGVTYSDETVRRFAALHPAADNFRIMWDNAYCIHHLTDTPDHLLNIYEECKKNGTENMVYLFASTSKITFPGAGLAAMAGSLHNLGLIRRQMAVQTIGHDKVNQLRHIQFFGNFDGILRHMEKLSEIILPRFNTVLDCLDKEIAPLEIAEWKRPNGGYFISVNTLDGCAKRVVQLCKEAGLVLTEAGAPFPYGKDPRDRTIRIAPTYPSVDELKVATELFSVALRLASVEKILETKED